MSAHWWHVAASWGAALALFAGLAGSAMARHRAARAALARLERRA
jgi:hypothetical protein